MDDETKKEVKESKKREDVVYSVGRRKEALAKVRLTKGVGRIVVNGKSAAEYFPGPIFQRQYTQPLEITKTQNKYNLAIKVEGGGKMAQLGAVVHGISKALARKDQSLRPTLKREGFLTRDARVKERRKYGHAGKARARKQSPKR